MSTHLDRIYSHKFLPSPSSVELLLNPPSKWSLIKKWTTLMFLISNRSIRPPRYSFASSWMNLSTVSKLLSHSYSSSCRTNSPMLASEALSPERPRTIDPSGALVVGPKLDRSTGEEVSYEFCFRGYVCVILGAGISIARLFSHSRMARC